MSNRSLSVRATWIIHQSGKTPYWETLPSSITDEVILCVEMSSRDNSS